MAPKSTKQPKKDSTPKDDAAASDVSMTALASLLENHKAAPSAEFRTTIFALESKIDLVQATVSSHGQRITSLEFNTDLVNEHLLTLEAVCGAIR